MHAVRSWTWSDRLLLKITVYFASAVVAAACQFSMSAEFLIFTIMTTRDCGGQVDMLDVDVNVVIEADLHLLSVIVIQLGTVPAQYVFVVFCAFVSDKFARLGNWAFQGLYEPQ